jgi:GAF domain-containing protein
MDSVDSLEEAKPESSREPLACTVYHGPAVTQASFGEPASDDRMRTRWRPAHELFAAPTKTIGPAVLIVDASLLEHEGTLHRLPHHVMIVAGDSAAATSLGRRAHISLATIREVDARRGVLAGACELSCLRLAAAHRRRELVTVNRELRELNRIGIALMAERDRTVLLHKILDVGKRLTQSDAGGMLLAEPDERQMPRLRAVLYEFDSLPTLPVLVGDTLPVDDSSIIGHVAATKRHVVVDDAYSLPPHAMFIANQSFDETYGYHRRSMLVVPMVDHEDVLVGVMAFINRKSDPTAKIRTREAADRWVLPYTKREVRLARSLASQAAVSIENADLHARIEHMLESFLKAAVTAIDQRDPTTAGHSMRVAALTTGLADAAERSGRGLYRGLRFTRRQMRELRYAALLHDFGKVSVPDDVLMKAKSFPRFSGSASTRASMSFERRSGSSITKTSRGCRARIAMPTNKRTAWMWSWRRRSRTSSGAAPSSERLTYPGHSRRCRQTCSPASRRGRTSGMAGPCRT